MKIRMTVSVEIDDPYFYDLDDQGWAQGPPTGKLTRDEIGGYVADAVSSWGGQFAPGCPLFSRNIKAVRVQGTGFDIKSG